MNFIKNRLPDRRAVTLVFSAVIFAVFTWTVRSFIFKFPAYILYLRTWDIVAILADLLTFALLESLLVTGAITGIAILFPQKWLRKGFAYKGFITVVVASIVAIYLKEAMTDKSTTEFFLITFSLSFMLWIGLILAAHFWLPLQKVILDLADRFSIFLYLYIPLGLVGVTIFVIRVIW